MLALYTRSSLRVRGAKLRDMESEAAGTMWMKGWCRIIQGNNSLVMNLSGRALAHQLTGGSFAMNCSVRGSVAGSGCFPKYCETPRGCKSG
jgi:hypothetical protein